MCAWFGVILGCFYQTWLLLEVEYVTDELHYTFHFDFETEYQPFPCVFFVVIFAVLVLTWSLKLLPNKDISSHVLATLWTHWRCNYRVVNPEKLNGNDPNEGSLYVFISVELWHPHHAAILRDQFRRVLKVRYG